jgi:LytS/YehU family sensor histidine kinase
VTFTTVKLGSKGLVFIAVMAVLGNTLSMLSIGLANAGQIGLDLSHIATFIAAVYGGPYVGCLTGLLSGLFSGVYFGSMGGFAWLGLIGLPLGKALTGLTTGALCQLLKVNQRSRPSILVVSLVLIGYIPECLFTAFFFLALVPHFFGWASVGMLITILVKAWIEVGVMSIFMGVLTGNAGFNTLITNGLTPREVK